MNDLSFIRLEPTFDKAKYTRYSPLASIPYVDFIQLLTNETYVQVSNLDSGIAFDGNYQVLVVDCNDTQLADVTTSVAIEQFTDPNGIPQIKFEIANLGVDFYKKNVFLKFIHTVSNAVWYSNPLIISNYQSNYTTRFDYMNYDGTNIMRSIRLRCYFDLNDATSTSEEYTSINGTKVTSRLILTEFEKYKFERIDNFTYRRLNAMLSNSIIYVNGYRMTDKVVSESTERIVDTNNFKLDFKVAINYKESYTSTFQIFENLSIIDQYPVNNNFYTIDINTPFYVQFDRNISITDNTINAYLYRNGVLVQTVTPTALDDTLTLNFTYTFDNAVYYILVDSGKITSELGEVWTGFTLSTDWTFEIESAQFDNTEFNNEFLI